MHLMTQTTMRRNDSIVMMFTLMPDRETPRDSDEGTEIVFLNGLVDGNGESPDFVVSIEDITAAVDIATFEIADQPPSGMALRAMSPGRNLDEAVRQVAAFVATRAASAYNESVTFGSPQLVL